MYTTSHACTADKMHLQSAYNKPMTPALRLFVHGYYHRKMSVGKRNLLAAAVSFE
jgi:hypothetical protein